jgi:ketosteroid isomerase-like protein
MSTAQAGDAQSATSVVERFHAAMMAWDEEALRSLLHEDAELHQPPTLPYGGIYRGPAEMMKLWKNVVLPLANSTATYVDSTIADGDHVVVIAGSTMNDKPVLACEDYLVRDGKIARIRMFWFDPTPVATAPSTSPERGGRSHHRQQLSQATASDAPTDSGLTRAVVERFGAALLSWDEDALHQLVAEDAELHQPPTLPYGGVHRGRDALLNLWKNVILPLHDHDTVVLDSFLVDGDRAMVISGANTTKGGEYTFACQDFTIRGGRITRIRMFWWDPRPVADEAAA